MAWWRRHRSSEPEHSTQPAAAAASTAPTRPLPAPGYPRAAVILVSLGGATVTAFGLWAIQGFLAPVLLALVLTICVHPLRVAMERWGLRRGLATGTVMTATFVLLAAFVGALLIAFAQFAALLPQYAPQLQKIGTSVTDWLASVGFGPEQIKAVAQGFDPSRIMGFLSGVLGGVSNLAFAMVVILTMLILMAVDAGALKPVMRQLATTHPYMVDALSGFATGVRRYMVATTALGIVQGALNWLALVLLGVPGAFLWGMLSFLCSFIPNIGYFIAIVPPLVFGLLSGGWGVVIAIIVIYAIINAVVQSIIQPRVVGNAVALSQTITFLSVLFWAVVMGPIGAILAIPLTLLVRTLLIDSDPNAKWWRPVIGDQTETRELQKQDDELAKTKRLERESRRKDARAARGS